MEWRPGDFTLRLAVVLPSPSPLECTQGPQTDIVSIHAGQWDASLGEFTQGLGRRISGSTRDVSEFALFVCYNSAGYTDGYPGRGMGKRMGQPSYELALFV